MVAQEHNCQPRLIAGLAQESSDIVHIRLNLVVTQCCKALVGCEGVEAEEDSRDEILMFADPLRVDEAIGVERGDGA